ncbi:hypothetical protein D9M68_572370 [compost metagenome]
MARRPHHHVYVIELHPDVLLEPKFRKCNPGFVDGKPCVYVGMTGLDPDVRFDKHKAGIQANAYCRNTACACCPTCTRASTRCATRMRKRGRWKSASTCARPGLGCGRPERRSPA